MPPLKYTILQPIHPAEKCYLREVLLWRAFGRLPEVAYCNEDEWRFSDEIRESKYAPIPGDDGLSEEECRFAGIPPDPTYLALLNGYQPDYENTQLLLNSISEKSGNINIINDLEAELSDAKKYEESISKWRQFYEDIADQYMAEICLCLRKGDIVAYGTLLRPGDMTDDGELVGWPDETDNSTIPKEAWISSHIDWEGSALYGREKRYLWVHVNVEEMLAVFPPSLLLPAGQVTPAGSAYAVVSAALPEMVKAHSKRGRPSLPWDDFHVEVARMYRDGEVPEKKEAAIASLQEWFEKTHGMTASRAAVGQRLKPYFDRLSQKDRK